MLTHSMSLQNTNLKRLAESGQQNQVISFFEDYIKGQGENVLFDSRLVATWMGRKHFNLLRDIRENSSVMLLKSIHNTVLMSDSFAIEKTYTTDNSPKEYTYYELSMDAVINLQTRDDVLRHCLQRAAKRAAQSITAKDIAKLSTDVIRTLCDQVDELQKKIEEQAPMIEAFFAYQATEDCVCVREACKAINIPPGNDIGYPYLHSLGFIYKTKLYDKWIPYQTMLDRGFMAVKLTANNTKISSSYFTPEGIEYLRKQHQKAVAKASAEEECLDIDAGI